MEIYEIAVIVICVLIVSFVFGLRIYKLITKKGSYECACCKNKGNNLKKWYYKKNKKVGK